MSDDLRRAYLLGDGHSLYDAHLMVARHLASILILEHNCCLASQHIRGEFNVVADLLSFAPGASERGKEHPLAFNNPPNNVLTCRFHQHLTSQVPASFRISQLPSEVLCWVTPVLQTETSSLAVATKGATKAPTESGEGGKGSAVMPDTGTTPSSLCYPTSSASSSSSFSSIVTARQVGPPSGTLQESVRSWWFQALCFKQQANCWLRRFGVISGTAPCTSRAALTSNPSSDPWLRHLIMLTPPPKKNSSGP